MGSNSGENSPANRNEVYFLDLKNRTISQPMGRDLPSPKNYKFVQIEVVKAVNPKLHPVRFEVHYETADREKILLGTFSLFPADNPGKFIVSTQGKLKGNGSLILSLVLPENIDENDTLQVSVMKIKLNEN